MCSDSVCERGDGLENQVCVRYVRFYATLRSGVGRSQGCSSIVLWSMIVLIRCHGVHVTERRKGTIL